MTKGRAEYDRQAIEAAERLMAFLHDRVCRGGPMKQHWRAGDQGMLTYRDCRVLATVTKATLNGRLLCLTFDAVLGKHPGAMPVLADDDGEFWSIISGEPVILSVKPAREA